MLPTSSAPKARILLVDDNPAIHTDFRKILCESAETADQLAAARQSLFDDEGGAPRRDTFEIDSAMQGEEAIELMRRAIAEGRPYAMAFIDVRMPPGLDGIETTQKLWHVYPDLQVVICTAYSDYSWVEMIGKIGQSDRLLVLKKPFDNIEALQLAHALTEKWQLLQQTRVLLASMEQLAQRGTAPAHRDGAVVAATF